jgi:hypothetical protein
MTDDDDWLPTLLPFAGDWFTYVEVLYACYLNDFVDNLTYWRGKRVAVARDPEIKGKGFSFWHLTSGVDRVTGEVNEPDLDRCARLAWIRAVIEAAPERVLTWEQVRPDQVSIGIALPDFSFVIFLAERHDWVFLRTAYYVPSQGRREKYRREYESSKKR